LGGLDGFHSFDRFDGFDRFDRPPRLVLENLVDERLGKVIRLVALITHVSKGATPDA
jgi:hypothetical protein